jgi:hypothetical protein
MDSKQSKVFAKEGFLWKVETSFLRGKRERECQCSLIPEGFTYQVILQFTNSNPQKLSKKKKKPKARVFHSYQSITVLYNCRSPKKKDVYPDKTNPLEFAIKLNKGLILSFCAQSIAERDDWVDLYRSICGLVTSSSNSQSNMNTIEYSDIIFGDT